MTLQDDYSARIGAVRKLRKLHAIDIFFYFTVTGLSFAVLIGTAIWLIRLGELELAFGMFGSTGVITVLGGKMLTLWTDSLQFVATGKVGRGKR